MNYKIIVYPFRKVFHNRKWAQSRHFDGYFAYLPVEGNLGDPALVEARRRNLAEVLACVRDDLKSQIAQTRDAGEKRALREDLESLRRVNPAKEPLPRSVRVDFAIETTEWRSLSDGSFVPVWTKTSEPYHKTLDLADLMRTDAYCSGYRLAVGKAMADVWDNAVDELVQLEKEMKLIKRNRRRDRFPFLDDGTGLGEEV